MEKYLLFDFLCKAALYLRVFSCMLCDADDESEFVSICFDGVMIMTRTLQIHYCGDYLAITT